MKKYVPVIFLGWLGATLPALAVTTWDETNCEAKGGTRVEANSKTWCKATSTMNWWSAYSWCQAMGGHLPSVTELCPNLQSITSGASCGSFPTRWVWTSTQSGPAKSWLQDRGYLSSGGDACSRHYQNSVYCLPNN